MFKSVIELLRLLTPQQRKELAKLQILVVLMAIAEIVGVASIGPFMALVGNMDMLSGDNKLARLYQASGIQTPADFVIVAGLTSLSALTLSAVITVITLWRLSIYGAQLQYEIGDRLFSYYMHQPWLYHAAGSTATLNKKIASDTSTLSGNVIQPLLNMNARIVLAVFIIIPIVIINIKVTIIGLVLFGSAYACIYQLVKHQLNKNGRDNLEAQTQRYTLMAEGFGGIKDVLLLSRQNSYVQRFMQTSKKLSYTQGTNQTIQQSPRYIMEIFAFAAIIFLVMYLINKSQGDLGVVLPTLAIYALAGFKLLPAFQNIYHSIATIKSGLPALESLREDLINSKVKSNQVEVAALGQEKQIQVNSAIQLSNISFTYPNKTIPAIKDLSINIPAKKVVGIVGATGSGKSTLIDILLGLVPADEGEITVDGVEINHANLKSWQKQLGFVPQSIYLANSTMLENVGFGLPIEEIDIDKVNQAIKMAHLDELVSQLPDGINTAVGERGVQLSGGQRQRIGIARALYHQAEILILDEATSALDGITERFIMDAIHDFSGEKTIIMIAHRFATVQKCDIIYMMENGKLIDQGSYEELLEKNVTFKRMAQHA